MPYPRITINVEIEKIPSLVQ